MTKYNLTFINEVDFENHILENYITISKINTVFWP